MSRNSKIEWTDHTWPIVNGCRRVSAGCQACYAERLTATRLRHLPKYAGLAEMTASGPRWTGETRLWEPDLTFPLKLHKPSRIFVADMGDLFYEGVPDATIDRVFAVMVAAPRHTFQILTKRPERMRDYCEGLTSAAGGLRFAAAIAREFAGEHTDRTQRVMDSLLHDGGSALPLPNVHLGVSVEDKPTADERIPLLLETPAAVRFVSAEPLLGPVDLSDVRERMPSGVTRSKRALVSHDSLFGTDDFTRNRIDWVICGGESGPRARPCDVAWIRSVVTQCSEANVACHVKQLGANVVIKDENSADDRWFHQHEHGPHPPGLIRVRLRDPKGACMDEWPEDLRVRMMPGEEWP